MEFGQGALGSATLKDYICALCDTAYICDFFDRKIERFNFADWKGSKQ